MIIRPGGNRVLTTEPAKIQRGKKFTRPVPLTAAAAVISEVVSGIIGWIRRRRR